MTIIKELFCIRALPGQKIPKKRGTAAQLKLEAARKKLLQMHKEGVDASYYGDPVAWQRDSREDTGQPFRGDNSK